MAGLLTEPRPMTAKDEDDLIEIWEMSFHDDPAYIRTFMQINVKPENTLVSHEDGRAVSAAYLLPREILIQDKTYQAMYFYAAATHPEYRHRGHMSRIIASAVSLCRERGTDFLYLVPGEASLYKYYSTFGFRTVFYARTVNFNHAELEKAVRDRRPAGWEPRTGELIPARPTDLAKVRETSLAETDHVVFSPEALQYALFEHASTGGQIIATGDSYALYQMKDGVVEVQEICPATLAGEPVEALLRLNADKYVFHAPSECELTGRKKTTGRAGMAIALTKKARTASGQMQNAYLGLTLG